MHKYTPPGAMPEANDTQDSATLFVSLYVVLLAFFILLNAISVIDDRRHKEALHSVLSTFSLPQDLMSEVPRDATGRDMLVDPVFAELRELVELSLPLDKQTVTRNGAMLFMEFPAERLFEVRSTVVRPDMEPFLERLTSTLTRWQDGVQMDVDIIMGTGQPLPSAPSAASYIELARAGQLARLLIARGVAQDHISISTESGMPGTLKLVFTVHSGQIELRLPARAPIKRENAP